MRVLIVEAHARAASRLRTVLRAHGVVADLARTGEDALWMAPSVAYEVVLLDTALPGIDGLETCRRLRADGVLTPIAMLSVRGTVDDRIAGLDSGADDVLTRPFQLAEMLARLRALARRAPRTRPPVLRVGDLELDLASCEVRRGRDQVRLTRQERALLELLMRRPGKVVPRHELLDAGWDSSRDRRSNVLEVCIGCLRRKIDRRFDVRTIETVRGVGYRLVVA
ncbi:MAG TPA: response regulator transcription factor [Solirubrobacteraceae bacterium]|nr:response regulator transcription factor [Solirubrobacteraceae bacterium]